MTRYCMTCGREIPQGNSFCSGCGSPVPWDDRPASAEVPQPLVEKNPGHADPFMMEAPKGRLDVVKSISGGEPDGGDDGFGGMLTIVAEPLEDEEDDQATVVVPRERHVLVRDIDGMRVELLLPCIVGRGRAADKKVKGNLSVSRKHAKLFWRDGSVMVQDLDSTNGTYVNGREVTGDEAVPLPDGAELCLGTEYFTFKIEK